MKKVFSMVLAFILMLSTLPSAFAANEVPTKGSLTIHKYAHEKMDKKVKKELVNLVRKFLKGNTDKRSKV